MTAFLTNDQVEELLPATEEIINDIEKVLSKFSSGENVIQPVRTQIISPKHNSILYSMPCYLAEEDVYCLKTIGAGTETEIENGDAEPRFDRKVERRTFSCNITLYHGQSALPLIMMEGESLTMKRTTAASAVATKHLVNGEPKILAILGSGHLAKSHLEIFSGIYPFTEIRLWNHRAESAIRLVNEFKINKQLNVNYYDNVKMAVQDADVICLVTNSHSPVLNLSWVKSGAHINAVGACRPSAREIDDSIHQAIVYVDSRQAAIAEAGDIIQSKVEIYAEIGEVINGSKKAFSSQTTVFKSLGVAVEDAVSSYRVYNNWKSKN
ncbi:hypothetical protein CHUAL_003153 [Chamberlinius hualienensis]